MRNESILLSMEEENRAFCWLNHVNIPELFINYYWKKGCPSEQRFCCIFYWSVWRHEKKSKRCFYWREIRCGTTTHWPAKKNNVFLIDAYACCKIIINHFWILLYLIFRRFGCFVQTIAWVFDCKYMHFHSLPK